MCTFLLCEASEQSVSVAMLMQAAHQEAAAKLAAEISAAQEATAAQQATVATRDSAIAELEEQLRALREEAAALETAVGELSALHVFNDMHRCLPAITADQAALRPNPCCEKRLQRCQLAMYGLTAGEAQVQNNRETKPPIAGAASTSYTEHKCCIRELKLHFWQLGLLLTLQQ